MQARELVRVGREVVELLLVRGVLDVDVARRTERPVARRLEQDVACGIEPGIARERLQRPPVHRPRRGRAGGGDDRRREVDVRHQLAADRAPRDPRPAHDQRDARGRLVVEHLAGLNAVLAVEEAVVGGEQDQRVVELAGGAQRADDLGDPFVDGEQRLEPLAVLLGDRGDAPGTDDGPRPDPARLVADVRLVEGRRDRQRLGREAVPMPRSRHRSGQVGRVVRLARAAAVGRKVGDVEEERPTRSEPPHCVDRLPRVDVGLVRARIGRHTARSCRSRSGCSCRTGRWRGRRSRTTPSSPAGSRWPSGARTRSGTCRCAPSGSRRAGARRAACSCGRASRSRRSAPRCP